MPDRSEPVLQLLEPASRSLDETLALAPALLARAALESTGFVSVSVVSARAVVLGRSQHAGRVVDLAACAERGISVDRRESSGTAAFIDGRALVCTLALPSVAALAHDATAPTVLNRNVRPWLRGFARAGFVAHYFGREWIAVQQRPAALLGFEVSAVGAIVIEMFVGIDAPVSIPAAIATATERAVDRWRDKRPAALAELSGDVADPLRVASALMHPFAALRRGSMASAAPELYLGRRARVERPDDPAPAGSAFAAPVRVPIGYLDVATAPALWIGGDVLAPRSTLDAIASAVGAGRSPDIDVSVTPILGATFADLLSAATSAVGPAS